MKEYTGKQRKLNQHNTLLPDADADIKWFEQFNDRPGIHHVYTEKELSMLKKKMLTNIKSEISKLD